jgi:hypothetical protein
LSHTSVNNVLDDLIRLPRGAEQVAHESIGESVFGPAPGLPTVVGNQHAPFDAARVSVEWCVVSHKVWEPGGLALAFTLKMKKPAHRG